MFGRPIPSWRTGQSPAAPGARVPLRAQLVVCRSRSYRCFAETRSWLCRSHAALPRGRSPRYAAREAVRPLRWWARPDAGRCWLPAHPVAAARPLPAEASLLRLRLVPAPMPHCQQAAAPAAESAGFPKLAGSPQPADRPQVAPVVRALAVRLVWVQRCAPAQTAQKYPGAHLVPAAAERCRSPCARVDLVQPGASKRSSAASQAAAPAEPPNAIHQR